MRIELTQDPAEFADRTRAFLAARLERNLLATVLDNALSADRPASLTTGESAASDASPVFAIGSDPTTGEVVAAALRTPPWPMVATEFDSPGDARELLERWLVQDPALDGVSGEPDTARALIQAWDASTGGNTECLSRMALHSLTGVSDPPRPTPGGLRVATNEDRALLLDWMTAFGVEIGQDQWSAPAVSVDRLLASGRGLIWEDARPVAMLAHSTEIAGAVRIGPVYTPPEFRNRGYAGAAVAALSRRLLERGAERCMLFTDLANPTSNRIYASVGYVRFADWEQHRLLR